MPSLHVTSKLHNKDGSKIHAVLLGLDPTDSKVRASRKGFTAFPAQLTWETTVPFPLGALRTMLLSQEIYNSYLLSKIHHFTKNPMDVIFFNFPFVVIELIIFLFFSIFRGF